MPQDDDDDKKQKLLAKNEDKVRKRKVQAMLDGALLPSEVTADLLAETAAEQAARLRRAAERASKYRKVQGVRNTTGTDLLPHLTNVDVWVDPDVKNAHLEQVLRERGCREAGRHLGAMVYVVVDPAEPSRRVLWHALLSGAFIVTPLAFEKADIVRGVVVKYQPVTSARKVYCTRAFRDKHANIPAIIRAVCPRWTWVASLEDRRTRAVSAERPWSHSNY